MTKTDHLEPSPPILKGFPVTNPIQSFWDYFFPAIQFQGLPTLLLQLKK